VIKTIVPKRHFRNSQLLLDDDEIWNRLITHLPKILPADADKLLRTGILEACSSFLTENSKLREGRRTFAALQRTGKRQPAQFERWVKGLRMAADAWPHIKGVHDDRITEISRFDVLEAWAADAERRLKALCALKPENAARPSETFVRDIAQICRAVGLRPGRTGSLYDDDKPKLTWFQKFIIALDDELLGKDGLWPGKKSVAYEKAKAAWIAKAMRGDGKSGKARP
jgi:hypothetical protein